MCGYVDVIDTAEKYTDQARSVYKLNRDESSVYKTFIYILTNY